VFQDGLNILLGIAALVAILDYFGLKPKQRLGGSTMPLSRKWKLAIMLFLVASSLSLSIYSFYRSRHPKIVEKIVEKPVVVEKIIKPECPKSTPPTDKLHKGTQSSNQSAVFIPPNTAITATTNAPDSAAVGINTGTVTVNPPVNPNKPSTTYDLQGVKRTWSASGLEIDDRATKTFSALSELAREKDWLGLISLADTQKKERPEWLTPYLFAAQGHGELCDSKKAVENLKYFIDKADDSPGYKDGILMAKHNLSAIKAGNILPSCRTEPHKPK